MGRQWEAMEMESELKCHGGEEMTLVFLRVNV